MARREARRPARPDSVLMVPPLDAKPWPTLGPRVCDWIERNLVFGPGDLLGKQAQLSPEKRALVYRMYEVFPRGHEQAGRRRFRRVALSLRKGLAKTELAAWIAACELSPTGPVRCVGWTKHGEPVGGPVADPYIPMVAYTEEQTEDLAYGALRLILERSRVVDQFDIGLERVMRADGTGKAVALASSPSARDGARTTFQHFDEALALDTPLPTPTGWTTMGDVQVGDLLLGLDGRGCRVMGKSDVHKGRACYRLTCVDGSSVVADGGHLWTAFGIKRGWVTLTTVEMFEVLRSGLETMTLPTPAAVALQRGFHLRDFRVASVERAPSVQVQCIAVNSPDSLFLCSHGLIPTHNTHRFALPALKSAHRTMLANLPKRKQADAWALETTTAPAPGERSVAEDTMTYARAVAQGRAADAKLFFFHRQASEEHDLATEAGRRAAVIEASGADAAWSDIEGILEQWRDPTADLNYLARVWLNQLRRTSDRAFDVQRFQQLARPAHEVPLGAPIALGFDGSRRDDSTALVATEITTGFQWPVAVWERPFGSAGEGWEVPEAEVHAAVADCFERYQVFRLNADPPYWETTVNLWAGKYGEERVVAWWTNRKQMVLAAQAYANAVQDGGLTHRGDEALVRHIGNCHKRLTWVRDDKGERMWTVYKERPDSPNKIDVAVAAILSWEGRQAALALGAAAPTPDQDYLVEWI